MAFSMEANVWATYAVWSDPADDERVMRWVSDRYRALEPVSKGTYLGDRPAAARHRSWTADSFRRLGAMRRVRPASALPLVRVKPGVTPNEFEPSVSD